MLDALHLQLHSRVVANVQQPSAFVALRDEIDAMLNELLAFTAGTSEVARAYYLARAEEHAAPEGCGLLYVTAAAVHCDGKCGPPMRPICSLRRCHTPDRRVLRFRLRCCAAASRHAMHRRARRVQPTSRRQWQRGMRVSHNPFRESYKHRHVAVRAASQHAVESDRARTARCAMSATTLRDCAGEPGQCCRGIRSWCAHIHATRGHARASFVPGVCNR